MTKLFNLKHLNCKNKYNLFKLSCVQMYECPAIYKQYEYVDTYVLYIVYILQVPMVFI